MSRRFEKGFLKAYCEWAHDEFSPPQFNTWTALSIIAGALERRVWLPWRATYAYYPNIYVLLVSRPGQGKSVSSGKGVDLLTEVARRTSGVKILPTQSTEAAFLEVLSAGSSFLDHSSGREIIVWQNAGYLYASEGPTTLTNIFGDFMSVLTAFYDCPKSFVRKTKKELLPVTLQNICINMLACSTFTFLNELVSDKNIQGGFASRILYIVQHEKKIIEQKFQGGETPEINKLRETYQEALVQDLMEISKLTGVMTVEPDAAAVWEDWSPKQQAYLQSLQSENLQSILARTNTNVMKVSILLSAAESNDRIIRRSHMEQAIELVETVNKDVPSIFMRSRLAQAPGKGGAFELTRVILDYVQRTPNITDAQIKNNMTMRGFRPLDVDNVLRALLDNGSLKQGHCAAGRGTTLVAHGNAYDYL